ncbi:uncharacterized protein LOC113334564 [Papaver somniferum]|uniref:uncharacterized protein LOC113334564 n=1 Tax=Papaver somniferum TaxID=3469 RepID=UPI000E6F97B3|nr:uncharacterized protein LOC113334564 [Papaver somniferum]
MVNRNGISPSHIFFADDIFLFCNWDKRNTDKLLKLLKDYQQSSGQIVSMEKSKCFEGGTTDSRKLQNANNCGMSLSKFPDKYLGVNLIPGKIKSSYVWGYVDFLQSKVPGWMGDPSKKKLLTVKWEEVNSPLAEGGLGLRSLEDINKSLLMKLAWKMQNDVDEWVKFFQAKFQDKNGSWINYYKKSSIWIGIRWVMDEVFNNSRWIVGDGKSISV